MGHWREKQDTEENKVTDLTVFQQQATVCSFVFDAIESRLRGLQLTGAGHEPLCQDPREQD